MAQTAIALTDPTNTPIIGSVLVWRVHPTAAVVAKALVPTPADTPNAK